MEKVLNTKGEIEKLRLTEDDFDKKVIKTIECDWGYEDIILMTHPELDDNEAVIKWEGLYITNCPKNEEEIGMDMILCAIDCFLSVYQTYGSVTFNYPTLRKDMKECWESCH